MTIRGSGEKKESTGERDKAGGIRTKKGKLRQTLRHAKTVKVQNRVNDYG